MTDKKNPERAAANDKDGASGGFLVTKPPEANETHLGSSDAFLETEETGSRDADDITDERLDEELDEQ